MPRYKDRYGEPWSSWELNFLYKNYSSMPVSKIARRLGRTEKAVRVKANRHYLLRNL